jgi:uncharacterized protein YqcC (DUF446 family)
MALQPSTPRMGCGAAAAGFAFLLPPHDWAVVPPQPASFSATDGYFSTLPPHEWAVVPPQPAVLPRMAPSLNAPEANADHDMPVTSMF